LYLYLNFETFAQESIYRNFFSHFSRTVQSLIVRNICKNRINSNFSSSQIVAKLLVRLPRMIHHTKPYLYSYNPCKKIWSAATGLGKTGVITWDNNYGTQCMYKNNIFISPLSRILSYLVDPLRSPLSSFCVLPSSAVVTDTF
jgi:hypothetical protein